LSTGPSGVNDWIERKIEGINGISYNFFLLPEVKTLNQIPRHFYYLPKVPLILINKNNNKPIISFTVVLKSKPRPEDETIKELVSNGVLTLQVGLEIPSQILDELVQLLHVNVFPLFSREAIFEVIEHSETHEGESILFSKKTCGINPKVAFSMNLNRIQTMDILSALSNTKSNIFVRVKVSYRGILPETKITLKGNWAKIYDFLYNKFGLNVINSIDLKNSFLELVHSNMIDIVSSDTKFIIKFEDDENDNELSLHLFKAFLSLSGVIVNHQTVYSNGDTSQLFYSLRSRPKDVFELNYSEVLQTSVTRSKVLSIPMDELLSNSLKGVNLEEVTNLIYIGDTNHVEYPSRFKIKSMDFRQHKLDSGIVKQKEMIIHNGSVQDISLSLRPDQSSQISASAAELVRPTSLVAANISWGLDDHLIAPQGSPLLKRPLVDDPSSGIWRDIKNDNEFWFAPTFEVIMPAFNENPSTSPFVFIFERLGAASSGLPALAGHVKISLKKIKSSGVESKLSSLGNPVAYEVSIYNMAISLEVPFVDTADNQIKTTSFKCSIEQKDDTIIATASISNEWVRLFYGSLAWPNFQAISSKLNISYYYQGYVSLGGDDFYLVLDKKTAITPVLYSENDKSSLEDSYLDAFNLVYYDPNMELKFKKEVSNPHASPMEPDIDEKSIPKTELGSSPRPRPGPLSPRNVNKLPAVYTKSPQIKDRIKYIPRETRHFAIRSFIWYESKDIFFPCSSLGSLYLDKSGDVLTAIGCQEADRLGQISFKQYEEIKELESPFCKVFKSLQQPWRFLLLPSEYCITRYEKSENVNSYKPILFIYSLIDAENPDNNRITFSSTLQANIPIYILQDILSRLKKYTFRSPVLEFPTDIPSEITYEGALSSSASESIDLKSSVALGFDGSFQIHINTDLANALLLKSMLEHGGLHGVVKFKLPDNSELRSNLVLQLDKITGPWKAGPIEISMTSNGIALINKIESSVIISDLVIYKDSEFIRRIPVEVTLLKGQIHNDVFISLNPYEKIYPVYSLGSGISSIDEIRSYIEDILTNIIIIDLVNHENHDILSMVIKARIKNVPGEYAEELNSGIPKEILFTLPITSYLENRVIEFQITITLRSDESKITSWLEWDTETKGNVISITWDLIQ
jgi:hypothetical protein